MSEQRENTELQRHGNRLLFFSPSLSNLEARRCHAGLGNRPSNCPTPKAPEHCTGSLAGKVPTLQRKVCTIKLLHLWNTTLHTAERCLLPMSND